MEHATLSHCYLKCEDKQSEATRMCLPLPMRLPQWHVGIALSSVPVVEGRLSPDLAICIFLVDLYVISTLFPLSISSLFCGFPESGPVKFCDSWWPVPWVPLICFRSFWPLFSSHESSTHCTNLCLSFGEVNVFVFCPKLY